ncbi:MAG: class I SAM-dependent methyltransferase [Bdellovibrionales bacterium]|nr:class I SAM-dependent methyltransferase [Bdellovibrionales bacterium]
MSDFRDQFYRDYVGFKLWDSDEGRKSPEIFELEFKNLLSGGSAKVLEIGFGTGEFLDWAKARGHSVCGIELIPELVDQARARGHEAYKINIQELQQSELASKKFDLIVLFDVLEHLYVDEIVQCLKACKQLLAPRGQVFIRVPNGLSPFGLAQFNKDITHVTLLTPERLNQVGRLCGLRVTASYNAARVVKSSGKPRWLKRALYALRDIYEIFMGALYYSGRFPLDPNLVVILKESDVEISK